MESLLAQALTSPLNGNVFSPLQQTAVVASFQSDTCQWDGTCLNTETLNDDVTGTDQENSDTAVAEEPEKALSGLPDIVVWTVSLTATVVQLFIVTLIGWPIQILLWVITLVDVLYSQTIRILIGSWSKLLAYLFLFPIKLVLLPFVFIGWMYRIFFAVAKFPISGWMLLFGRGCFLRWGADCSAKKWSEREYYEVLTLPWLLRNPDFLMPKLPEGPFLDALAEHFEFGTDYL